jgi:hypothetical protein
MPICIELMGIAVLDRPARFFLGLDLDTKTSSTGQP